MRLPFVHRTPTARKKALVADDEAYVVRYVSKALERAGYIAITTTRHEEVPALAQSERVDLILISVPLRPLDQPGCEVLKAIRENLELASLPIIIMTGKTSTAYDLPWCTELPATRFITKPFHPMELLLLINREFPELAIQ